MYDLNQFDINQHLFYNSRTAELVLDFFSHNKWKTTLYIMVCMYMKILIKLALS